jgi:hypothetical protein
VKARLVTLLVLCVLAVGLAIVHRALALLVAHGDLIASLVSAGQAPDSGAVVASALALVVVRGALFFVLPPVVVLIGGSVLRRLAATPPRTSNEAGEG